MRHPPPVASTLAAGSNRSLGTRLYRIERVDPSQLLSTSTTTDATSHPFVTATAVGSRSATDPLPSFSSTSSTARCGERQRWRISRLSLIHVDSLIDDCTRRFLTRLVIWDISESEDSLLAGDRTSCRPVGLGRWRSVGDFRSS